MVQVRIKELFAPEIAAGIKMFTGGRDTYDYESLSPSEEDAVKTAFDKSLLKIEAVSPKVASVIRPQRDAFVKWAGVAKGTFPETKSYSYPSTAGGLGADWITPELYKYDTTPSATFPCYTGYVATASAGDSFDIATTAGVASYIAGNATETNSYKGSITTGMHSFVVIAQDGLVEIGTSPKFNMVKVSTDLETKYAPVAMQPLINQTVEDNKSIYQYNTPGMIPMDYQVGTIVKAYANDTGVSTIVPLGMVFYEHEFIGKTGTSSLPRSASTPA